MADSYMREHTRRGGRIKILGPHPKTASKTNAKIRDFIKDWDYSLSVSPEDINGCDIYVISGLFPFFRDRQLFDELWKVLDEIVITGKPVIIWDSDLFHNIDKKHFMSLVMDKYGTQSNVIIGCSYRDHEGVFPYSKSIFMPYCFDETRFTSIRPLSDRGHSFGYVGNNYRRDYAWVHFQRADEWADNYQIPAIVVGKWEDKYTKSTYATEWKGPSESNRKVVADFYQDCSHSIHMMPGSGIRELGHVVLRANETIENGTACLTIDFQGVREYWDSEWILDDVDISPYYDAMKRLYASDSDYHTIVTEQRSRMLDTLGIPQWYDRVLGPLL